MRKWCLTLMSGALLAMPGFAQQSTAVKNDSVKPATVQPAGTEVANNAISAPVARNLFAMPVPPRATPFPGPAAASQNDSEPGLLVPRYELAGMFSYIDFHPGDNPDPNGSGFNSFGNKGGTGSFTYNANKWLGLTGELGAYSFQRNVDGNQIKGGIQSYLFGPRLNWRKFNYFVPFGEFLIGGAHGGTEVTGGASNGQQTFALATGGGVDVVINKNVAWRFAQIDYMMTNFSGDFLGASSRQDNLRVGSGLVVRWGFPTPPPPPNQSPVASCSANPASVYAGSNDAAAIHVTASDPDNDMLTYSYTASGGTVEGTGPDARWNSSGLGVGTYTVTAKVDDGKGGTASCAADVKVEAKPNQAPTISCSTDRNPILPGERTGITSTASDPDNDPLTYTYTTSGGQISGEGAKVQFDSTGLQPGSYKVTCAVSDGKGGNAESSTDVDVQQPPPPPQATKVGDCGYNKPGASRFDNACKRVGDDVALRLQNEPNAKLVIVGFADPKEPRAERLAQTRADLASKYIVAEKGIDASRVSTRTGTASTEKGMEQQNRRVDFVIVPDGATY